VHRGALGSTLLSLLVLACGCARQAARSGKADSIRSRVRSVVAKPAVRRDLGARAIARLPGAARGARVQGLTLIRRSMAVRQTYSTDSDASTVSAWLDEVDVTISLSPITIYIPKEYPEGSCEHKALMAHEAEHARVAAAAAAAAARELERVFARASELPSRERPIVASHPAEVVKALKLAVDKILDPVYERFEKDLDREQAELDEPAGYDKLFSRCAGWR
jgi:hypothetical protein